MSSAKYFWIITILIFVKKSIPENIFCDKTQNFSIDSVLSEEMFVRDKFTFFIGEDFYELEPINKGMEKFKIISHKKLKDLNETLRPPIDTSFFTQQSENTFRLWNLKEFHLEFFKNRSFCKELPLKSRESVGQLIEIIRMNRENTTEKVRLIYSILESERNLTGLKVFYQDSNLPKYWIMTRGVGSAKQIRLVNETSVERYNLKNEVFYQLNGQNITALFVYPDYWHLFAGRQLCQMKISTDEWTDFCEIKDISDWIIGCNQTIETITTFSTTTTQSPKTTTTVTTEMTTTLTTEMTTNSINLITFKANDESKEENRNLIIRIAICLVVIILVGWLITIAVIYLTYRYTQAQRQRMYADQSTTMAEPSTVSSVKTIDSNTGQTT